jgi:hypothetical protein
MLRHPSLNPSTAVLTLRRSSSCPALHYLCYVISKPQYSCTHFTTLVQSPCFTLFMLRHPSLNPSIAVLTLRRSFSCPALHYLCYVISTPVQLYSLYDARPTALLYTIYVKSSLSPSTAVLTLRRSSSCPALHYLCYVIHL